MKVIDLVRRPDIVATDDFAAYLLGPFAGDVAGRPARIEVNLVDPASILISRARWPAAPDRFDAIIMRWYAGTAAPPLPSSTHLQPWWTFTVDEVIAIGARRDRSPDPRDATAVKRVAFLVSATTPEDFRAHYRHHIQLVHEYLPGIARYVQNDVTDTLQPDVPVAAVSELTFWTQHDFDHRWTRGAEGAAEFRAAGGLLGPTASDRHGLPRARRAPEWRVVSLTSEGLWRCPKVNHSMPERLTVCGWSAIWATRTVHPTSHSSNRS